VCFSFGGRKILKPEESSTKSVTPSRGFVSTAYPLWVARMWSPDCTPRFIGGGWGCLSKKCLTDPAPCCRLWFRQSPARLHVALSSSSSSSLSSSSSSLVFLLLLIFLLLRLFVFAARAIFAFFAPTKALSAKKVLDSVTRVRYSPQHEPSDLCRHGLQSSFRPGLHGPVVLQPSLWNANARATSPGEEALRRR
jgi:hypothetical protein